MQIGSKFDAGKPKYGQILKGILPSFLEVMEILEQGANTHGLNNWQLVESERFKNALHRHLFAWLDGEIVDKESGKGHLSHIICNCIFLRWSELNGKS